MTVGAQGCIEVIRHVFAGKIGDGAHAIKRQLECLRAPGDASGFHLDCDAAELTEARFLRGCLCDVIDRANRPAEDVPNSLGRVVRLVRDYPGARNYIGDLQGFFERAAETGADNGLGMKVADGGVHRRGGAFFSDSIGDQHHFISRQIGGARPIEGEIRAPNVICPPDQSREFHAVSRDEEQLHYSAKFFASARD